MTVLQGLTSLVNNPPNFTNANIVSQVNAAKIYFVPATYNVAVAVAASAYLTPTEKSNIYSVMETQGYLNIGRYLLNLVNQTAGILSGVLGQELIPGQGSGSFLDHLGLVNGIQGAHQYLYGQPASASGQGINDYFGSVAGVLTPYLADIAKNVTAIHNLGWTEETNFINAAAAITNYVNTLADSSAYNNTTATGLFNTFITAANAFNAKLSDPRYVNLKNSLINDRNAVAGQLSKEFNNLTTMTTTSTTLNNTIKYQGMAANPNIAAIVANTAGSAAWTDYFANYQSRLSQVNPKFVGVADSSISAAVAQELKLQGQPAVTNSNNLQQVCYAASQDTRLQGRVTFSGRTVAQIIADCCRALGINITGLDTYGQSDLLLKNINANIVATVTAQVQATQTVTTLS